MVRSSLHRCSNATQQDYWTAASALTTHIANASNLLLPTPDPATSYLDDDLDYPLIFLACDLGFPMQAIGIHLRDLFYAFHELWEFIKSDPLIVSSPYRHVDIDGPDNG